MPLIVTAAMVLTTMDLVEKYHDATAGFTESDEISLVFPALVAKEETKGGGVEAAATTATTACETSAAAAATSMGGAGTAATGAHPNGVGPSKKKQRTNTEGRRGGKASKGKVAEEPTMMYGGRVQKVSSLVAGYVIRSDQIKKIKYNQIKSIKAK